MLESPRPLPVQKPLRQVVPHPAVRLLRVPRALGMVPWSWLKLRLKAFTVVRDASANGIVPVNWFFVKNMACMFLRLPNVLGIVPWKTFQPKCRNVSDCALPSSLGSAPESPQLKRKSKYSSADNEPMDVGSVPTSWFNCNSTCFNAVMVPRNDGKVPTNPLPPRLTYDSPEHALRLLGSVPVYALYASTRYCSDVGNVGSGPVIPPLFQICKYVNADSCEIAGGKVPTSDAA